MSKATGRATRETVKYVDKTEVKTRERKQVVVDRVIDDIYAQHQTVTEDLILEEAEDPKHPLHNYFEWDDTVAAQKYRKAQALAMIMASKFVVVMQRNGEELPKVIGAAPEVRRLVSAFRGEGFKMRREAMSDAERRSVLVERKKSVLKSWCRETVDYPEFSELRELILAHL